MKTYAWKDLNHKVSPARQAEIKHEALEAYDRLGFAALRKARRQTQVELARKLGINQASVSGIENSTDLLLSTLTRYVRALGGDVRVQAVFPEATFDLAPIATALQGRHSGRSSRLTRATPKKVHTQRRSRAIAR